MTLDFCAILSIYLKLDKEIVFVTSTPGPRMVKEKYDKFSSIKYSGWSGGASDGAG